MGSAIAASRVQTERARKRRREGHEPEKPTSTPLPIRSSDIKFDDAAAHMAKRRKKGEEERVKSKKLQKAAKKSHVKKGKVKKGTTVKSSRAKVPGPSVQNPVADKEMTKEERITEMEKQKVLNDNIFYPDIITEFGMSNLFAIVSFQGWGHLFEPQHIIFMSMRMGGIKTTVKGVEILLDEETLGIILGVPVEGIRSIECCKPFSEFSTRSTKRGDVKHAGLPKKFLNGEYQMLFEFINKVLVPRTEKITITSVADLFLMEKLDELEEINLPAIMLEHMHKVMTWKKAKHEIPYGYLLNYVLNHFEVPMGRGVPSTRCLLQPPCWNSKLQKAVLEGPGTTKVDEQVVLKLRDENAMLLKTNVSLSEEVKALNKQLIQAYEDANERMLLLMHTLNPLPSPS
ncbi:hypothetical protein R3W88_027905 [Solanum pinnatisectum]|uniref:Uncharacterized protein n=1 Tax=Solanum pinnatisectum TaxID=50273 RepID=A0AAV9LHD2_9SOLN|nr:hypothetical protein R3W88_027905 [Solanum pinnatisectum]